MEISTEALTGIITAVGAGGAGTWAYCLARLKSLEKERASAEVHCRLENEKLVARLVLLEDRAHKEDREDRVALLRTAENSSKAVENNSLAFKRLAERLPEVITASPPRGQQRLSDTITPNR